MCRTTLFKVRLYLVLSCAVASLGLAVPAVAEDFAGTYRGFLAFDYKGEEVREWMMITFHGDGTLIMGAEEGHDEPVDPATGLATRNDVESANLGAWREAPDKTLEFGTQQMRAGSGFCAPVNNHPEGLLPTCSFVLTARLSENAEVRGESCDLGGVGGGFSLQSVDGRKVDANPFSLDMTIDYCLEKMTVDRFFELAPMKQTETLGIQVPELRKAIILAQRWNGQGQHQGALALAAPRHDGFTEDFDTPDLLEAKALLDALLQ